MHYTVKDVQLGQHEKILHLVGSYTQEQVVVHLQDGWHDTPVEPGHSVNLIAEKVVGSDGLLHATCDFDAGRACSLLPLYVMLGHLCKAVRGLQIMLLVICAQVALPTSKEVRSF